MYIFLKIFPTISSASSSAALTLTSRPSVVRHLPPRCPHDTIRARSTRTPSTCARSPRARSTHPQATVFVPPALVENWTIDSTMSPRHPSRSFHPHSFPLRLFHPRSFHPPSSHPCLFQPRSSKTGQLPPHCPQHTIHLVPPALVPPALIQPALVPPALVACSASPPTPPPRHPPLPRSLPTTPIPPTIHRL